MASYLTRSLYKANQYYYRFETKPIPEELTYGTFVKIYNIFCYENCHYIYL
jgi:hypothetical protein